MKSILTYNQGDALQELKDTKDELHKLDGFELAAHFSGAKEEVQTLRDYKYFHIWAAILIKHGKAIKKHTDDFISEFSNVFINCIYVVNNHHCYLLLSLCNNLSA